MVLGWASTLALGTTYTLCAVLVGIWAQVSMYRSFWGWTILSLLFSPLAAFIFLEVAGPPLGAGDRLERDRRAERQRKAANEERHAEYACPWCGNGVNLVTQKGLEMVENEPWRLICANCQREIDADKLTS